MTWTPTDTRALRTLLVLAPDESQKLATRLDPLCQRAAAEIERLTARTAELEPDNRRLWNALRSLKEFAYKLGEAVTGECEP